MVNFIGLRWMVQKVGEDMLDWGGSEGDFTPFYRFDYCAEEVFSRSSGISVS